MQDRIISHNKIFFNPVFLLFQLKPRFYYVLGGGSRSLSMDSYVCPHIATPPSRISNGPSRHYLGAHQGDEDHGIDLDLLEVVMAMVIKFGAGAAFLISMFYTPEIFPTPVR